MIATNTFNSTAHLAGRLPHGALVGELNLRPRGSRGAAADAVARRHADGRRFVAGALGPTSRTASLSPDVNDPGVSQRRLSTSWRDAYAEAARALIEGGVDCC